jgi:hypothetical protein
MPAINIEVPLRTSATRRRGSPEQPQLDRPPTGTTEIDSILLQGHKRLPIVPEPLDTFAIGGFKEASSCVGFAGKAGPRVGTRRRFASESRLRCPDRHAMLRRTRNSSAVNATPDSITEAPRRSIDHSQYVVARLQNSNRLGATQLGGELALLINAAARTVKVGQIGRDAIYAAPVAVDGVFNGSLDLLLQILIPFEMTCSNCKFHRYLLLFLPNSRAIASPSLRRRW